MSLLLAHDVRAAGEARAPGPLAQPDRGCATTTHQHSRPLHLRYEYPAPRHLHNAPATRTLARQFRQSHVRSAEQLRESDATGDPINARLTEVVADTPPTDELAPAAQAQEVLPAELRPADAGRGAPADNTENCDTGSAG